MHHFSKSLCGFMPLLFVLALLCSSVSSVAFAQGEAPDLSAAASQLSETASEAADDAEEALGELVGDAQSAAEEASAEAEAAAAGEDDAELQSTFDEVIGTINDSIAGVLFFDVGFGKLQAELPFILVILLGGGLFFTFFYGFINIRGFKHSIDIIRGKYDNPDDEGEISHFRALTSALSATVGLGNIAGVAIAVSVGGPGAVFWMLVTAFFGMCSKFHSCTLSQMFRKVNPDGTISGGPMYYLEIGLGNMGGFFKPFGLALGIIFAFFAMGGAIGGGNMFQANQSYAVVSYVFNIQSEAGSIIYGLILAILVGAVILGGIKRIGAATARIIPFMAIVYVTGCLVVIFTKLPAVPGAITSIFVEAFKPSSAITGGFIGVLVQGVRRGAFSNEAGLGSAAIAHAAAKTKEPVREGLVAMIGPFVDTIVICLMTATVILVTGMHELGAEEQAALVGDSGIQAGAALTAQAFGDVMSWFPVVLAVAVVLFAYSTMISWCYYGERGWIYLLDKFGEGTGLKTVIVFRIFFIGCVFVGAVANLGPVLDFTDLLILSMAYPNIIGGILLAPIVVKALKDYMKRLNAGEMKTYK